MQDHTDRQIISAPQQKKKVNRGAKGGSVAGTGWAVTRLQGVVKALTAPLFPQAAWCCTAVTPRLYLKGVATCCISLAVISKRKEQLPVVSSVLLYRL